MTATPALLDVAVAGAFFAMAGFGALLVLQLRDRAFAWYTAIALAFGGLSWLDASPGTHGWHAWHAALSAVEVASIVGFALTFFAATPVARGVRWTLVALGAFDVAGHAFADLGGPAFARAGVDLVARYAFVAALGVYVVAVLRAGGVAARPMLVGLVLGALGVGIGDLAARGVLAAAAIPYGHAGVAIGTVLLAAGLAARLRHVEREAVRLERLAHVDGLTGIANRRRLDETLLAAWDRARRARAPLAALMVDIDRFKRYNDTYGHQAGDDVLRAVALTVRGVAARRDDLTARYGGEEFVVLLPATDAEAAREIAERVRAAVSALRVPHEGVDREHLTVSIGVAAVRPADGGLPEDLITRADAAMYIAKEAGRDRVAVDALDALHTLKEHDDSADIVSNEGPLVR